MPDRTGWERRPGFSLVDRLVLIAGAETEAGAAVARACAGAGASLALVAATKDAAAIRPLSDEVAKSKHQAYVAAWDVTDPTAVDRGMQHLIDSDGAPAVLVTAFDATIMGPIEQIDDADYRRVMSVIVDGTWYACRAFMRALPRETQHPRIICLTNVFGERGVDNLSVYAAAHGAVHNLVRTLAQELGPRNNGTVNAIAAGWMTTTPGRGPDEIGQNRLMRFVPMRRFGTPDELAPLAVLLASEASGYISGQVLHVDGGITTHL